MTLEGYLMTAKVIMWLDGLIVVLSFLYFKRRSLFIKLLGFDFLSQFLAYHSMGVFDLRGMNVNIPSNIQILVTFLCVSGIYYFQFQKRHTRTFLALVIFFFMFWFIDLFFVQKTHVNSYSASILYFVMIAYSLIYFYRLLIDMPAQRLRQVPMFWINIAFLIQSAGGIFLFLFVDYLTEFFSSDMLVYFTLHNMMIGFQHVLLLTATSLELKSTLDRSHNIRTDVLEKDSRS